jgi:hypothetical protein
MEAEIQMKGHVAIHVKFPELLTDHKQETLLTGNEATWAPVVDCNE